MKFKKVLASAMAAAMALTTMVTTSFTASAADVSLELSVGDSPVTLPYTYGAWDSAWMKSYDASIAGNETVTVQFDLTATEAAGKWDGFEVFKVYGGTFIVNGETVEDYTFTGNTSTTDYTFKIEVDVSDDNGIGFNSQACHSEVVLTSAKLVEDSGATEPPVEDEPIVPASSVIWEGSTAMTTGASDHGWDGNVQIDAAKITSEGTITVTMTDVAQGAQYGIRDGSWNKLLDYSEEMAAGTASFTYTITASDLEAITSTGALIIAGHDFTVTKVEFAAASSGGNSSGKPGEIDPEAPKPVDPDVKVVSNVVSAATVPTNSAKTFEITDPVTGKAIPASVNKLAKSLSKLTEGSELAFDTGTFGLVLRKNAVKEIVDNDLTLTIKTSKATFIIDAENLAKVKTINIPAIMKTAEFKKLLKEGNTFNVIVTEKNKVEIELA